MKKITKTPQIISHKNLSATIKRQVSGITDVKVETKNAMAFAQALCHCEDRFMQIFLLRIIGKGRVCELLDDSESSLSIDIFMRQMNFFNSTNEDVAALPSDVKSFFESYVDGINFYLETRPKTWEFKLLGVHIEPWTIQDSLTVIKLMSYIGLAQTQQDAEKFIIQSIRENIDLDKLKALFSPNLENLDNDIIDDLKSLKFFEGLLPDHIRFNSLLPKMMASNNWIISPKKSETSSVIQANDPHLEINRLPGIWYEQVLHVGNRNYQGVSMPGLPGIIMGRSDDVSFGFTYGFMDMVDYFIEDVHAEKFLRDGEYNNFTCREEIIQRKKSSAFKFKVYENDCGTIESDPYKSKLDNGKYLNRAWSAQKCGAKDSAIALFEMLDCSDIHTLKNALRKISISCNWLLGDTKGNIAYQQSGICPKRNGNGLLPLRASDPLNHWDGFISPDDLCYVENPEEGFLATANNDLSKLLNEESPLTINLPMGPYRVNRIEQLLSEKEKYSVEDFKEMQRDLYSLQAVYYMNELRPLLAKDKVSSILKEWDFCYDRDSVGATVFENFYHNLLEEVFTEDFFHVDAWRFMQNRSSILVDFYYFFDQVILENHKSWFKNKSKMTCFKNALAKTQKTFLNKSIQTWGDLRTVKMTNLLFDGKLPGFLGFDYGPIPIEGSRATIVQGALYESHGRISTFCPSMRFITDLSQRKSYTILAGGVSDRRFSKLYTSEIDDWLNFRYKEVKLD